MVEGQGNRQLLLAFHTYPPGTLMRVLENTLQAQEGVWSVEAGVMDRVLYITVSPQTNIVPLRALANAVIDGYELSLEPTKPWAVDYYEFRYIDDAAKVRVAAAGMTCPNIFAYANQNPVAMTQWFATIEQAQQFITDLLVNRECALTEIKDPNVLVATIQMNHRTPRFEIGRSSHYRSNT